jgi:hypothetical protein
LGDRLLEQLQEYLSATAPRAKSRSLGLAREIAADYGRLAHEVGLGAPEAVEAYVLFRRPLLELLSRNVADHPELSGEFGRIIRDSERFMDQVLAELTGAQSAEAKHAAR